MTPKAKRDKCSMYRELEGWAVGPEAAAAEQSLKGWTVPVLENKLEADVLRGPVTSFESTNS